MTEHQAVAAMAVVETTVGSADAATALAQALVAEEICACCAIIRVERSVYRWQGQVVSEPEWLLRAKTTSEGASRVVDRMRALHPYTTPELAVFAADIANPSYAKWLRDNVKVA